jgi:hypothetical protein
MISFFTLLFQAPSALEMAPTALETIGFSFWLLPSSLEKNN